MAAPPTSLVVSIARINIASHYTAYATMAFQCEVQARRQGAGSSPLIRRASRLHSPCYVLPFVFMADATQSASRPLELTELLTLTVEVGERINSTLDLDELMQRIAEIVKRAIDYEVFAILLLNEKTQELHIRFSIGHPDELV